MGRRDEDQETRELRRGDEEMWSGEGEEQRGRGGGDGSRKRCGEKRRGLRRKEAEEV